MLSLEQCEDKIGEIINLWPRTTGILEVASQRAELAGWIECLWFVEMISEETRAILNAIYFQGWDRYVAIKQFGVKIKKPRKIKQKIVIKDVTTFPEVIPEK